MAKNGDASMRKLLMFGAMATAMALPPTAAEAYEGLWCLRFSTGRGSAERCSFQTFEACRDERSLYGTTAFCSQNPGYLPYWQARGFDLQPRKASYKKKRTRR
jgi:hypothetical protein